MIEAGGYAAETHHVVTEDGYILAVGHSQGMSALYVMLSTFPNLTEDISLVGFLIFNSWKLLFDKSIL